MRRSKLLFLAMAVFALVAGSAAQVVSPREINDPAAQRLQQQYLQQLQSVAQQVQAHKFAYPFYFSRVLDISQPQQLRTDQRSLRFDRFKNRTVLEITGNYYASYSDALMPAGQRVRRTYQDVLLPILQAAVPPLANDPAIQGFALEVSYHVRSKVMGMDSEHAENLVLVLPREAAQKLVAAKSTEDQQGALLDGQAYLNAQPIVVWLSDGAPPPPPAQEKASATEIASLQAPAAASDTPVVSPRLVKPPDWPARPGLSPQTLADLQAGHQDAIARLLREMDAQAHFVAYAPPAFIAFHDGAYLQVSMETPLEASAAGSQYRLAALAFDQHIAHLVRPLLAYFPDSPDFDGVDFSTTVKLPGGAAPESVEFFLPFAAMRCFAQYNCTGQQLITSGFVLINGERAALDLQVAEATH